MWSLMRVSIFELPLTVAQLRFSYARAGSRQYGARVWEA